MRDDYVGDFIFGVISILAVFTLIAIITGRSDVGKKFKYKDGHCYEQRLMPIGVHGAIVPVDERIPCPKDVD